MFEVQDLRFATLATVSRCGMVWFSEDVLHLEMVFEHHLTRMRNISIDEVEEMGEWGWAELHLPPARQAWSHQLSRFEDVPTLFCLSLCLQYIQLVFSW